MNNVLATLTYITIADASQRKMFELRNNNATTGLEYRMGRVGHRSVLMVISGFTDPRQLVSITIQNNLKIKK